MEKRLYTEGEDLKENEFLFKRSGTKGFLTKLNKNKTIPVNFLNWPKYGEKVKDIYVVDEIFSSGWKILTWRFGESQNWASMLHPNGFTVEIYLQNLLELMENITIINCELQGEFKWNNHKLIKRIIK